MAALEALTAVVNDMSGQIGSMVALQTRIADAVDELVAQGASAGSAPPQPPPPAPSVDMSGVVSALKRMGDSVAQAVKQATAGRPAAEPETPAATDEAPAADDAPAATDEAPPADDAAEAPAADEVPAADEAPAEEAPAEERADEAPAAEPEAAAEPEPEPEAAPAEPEPAPAPASAALRVAVGHATASQKPGANLPPSIHKTAAGRGKPPVVRAPDTSEQGYAVAIKPAIAVALGKYLPKALKIVSDTLGKPQDPPPAG